MRKAIVRGVGEGIFAYTSGAVPTLSPDNKFQVSLEKVELGRRLAEDEVDIESGFLMIPSAVTQVPAPVPREAPAGTGILLGGPMPPVVTGGPGAGPTPPGPVTGLQRVVRLIFTATRDQVFKTFPAIASLADRSDGGKVTIRVEGTAQAGYDPSWFRNAVEEPLEEANVEWKPADSRDDSPS